MKINIGEVKIKNQIPVEITEKPLKVILKEWVLIKEKIYRF